MSGRWPILVSILLTLAALGPPPAGGHGGVRTWIVNAHDADTENGTVAWWTVDDGTQANPTLDVHQGERIVFHVVNLGERNHTLVLGDPIGETVGPISPGEEQTVSFEIPTDATGTIPYEDPAWASNGMRGQLSINGTQERQDSPAPPLSAALAAVSAMALLATRRRARR